MTNQVSNDSIASSRVVFYKTQAVPLTVDNVKTIVNVVTMSGPPEEAFLKSVQNVGISKGARCHHFRCLAVT